MYASEATSWRSRAENFSSDFLQSFHKARFCNSSIANRVNRFCTGCTELVRARVAENPLYFHMSKVVGFATLFHTLSPI